jgi:hypothetical protein
MDVIYLAIAGWPAWRIPQVLQQLLDAVAPVLPIGVGVES